MALGPAIETGLKKLMIHHTHLLSKRMHCYIPQKGTGLIRACILRLLGRLSAGLVHGRSREKRV